MISVLQTHSLHVHSVHSFILISPIEPASIKFCNTYLIINNHQSTLGLHRSGRSFKKIKKMIIGTLISASLFVAHIAAAPTTITILVDDGTTAGAAAAGGSPFQFTSSFNVVAIPTEVRNGTVEVTGAADATGYFNYGLNSASDTICYVSFLFVYLSRNQ